MTHPFRCPRCGYKNYLTADDLEKEQAEVQKAVKRLERKRLGWRRFWPFKSSHNREK